MRLKFQGDGLLEKLGVLLGMAPRPMYDGYASLLMARALMAAASIGLFKALAEHPRTAPELASHLGIERTGADLLLSALESLGYVRFRHGRYRLTRDAKRFLAPESETSVHPWIGVFNYDLWDHLGNFEAVLRGTVPAGAHTPPASDPYWDRYMEAMHSLARLTAPVLARSIAVNGSPRRALDLAGGHGRFSVELCRRYPDLRATIVDLEGAAVRGERFIEAAGMLGRIEYRHGDVFEADLGEGYDLALANNVIHMLSPERSAELLRRARTALRPGGTISVLEVERPPAGRPDNQFGALLGLVFYSLDRTPTYTASELSNLLEDAGFSDVRVKRPPKLGGNMLVTGVANGAAP